MDRGAAAARAPAGPGLVRVSVASATRRVDLVLPGGVPVAELVPELARSVGLLEPAVVHAGYRIVTTAGRELAAEAGLVAQGVEDGGLLTLAARIEDESPPRYDDVVEAMTDVVEHDLGGRHPATGRCATLGAGTLVMGLGLAALMVQSGSSVAGPSAAAVATVLTVAAILASRLRRASAVAVAAALLGPAYAGVAGLVLTDGAGPLTGRPLAAAGGAVLLTGLACLVGLAERRALAVPAVVLGAALGATGLLAEGAGLAPAVVLCSVLVLVVLAGSAFPSMALGVAQVGEVTGAVVDRERVAADARLAHELLVAMCATVGVLLVLVAPFAVSLGVAGTVLVGLCGLVVVLRARRHRVAAEVLAGVVSGTAGLATVAAASLWLHPAWRPATTVVVLVAGVALMALSTAPSRPSAPSVRLGWLGDVAEGAALLALLPVLVVAVGVLASIRA